jgi:hypothetical protein
MRGLSIGFFVSRRSGTFRGPGAYMTFVWARITNQKLPRPINVADIKAQEEWHMVSQKLSYWMAVGAVALFFGNNIALRHGDSVRCLADRAMVAVEQFSGSATRYIATAEMMLGRGETHLADVQTRLACAQTRLASVQTVIASHQAALALVEAEQARMVAIEHLDRAVVCPRQSLRMSVPQLHRGGTI